MTRPAQWYEDHTHGWQTALQKLRAAGWKVDLTCTAAPVQLEGALPTGERFYLRARHEEVELNIGGDDPADVPEWIGVMPYQQPGGFAASYLPAEHGLAIIAALTGQFHDGVPSVSTDG
jgi:hypothetical protein